MRPGVLLLCNAIAFGERVPLAWPRRAVALAASWPTSEPQCRRHVVERRLPHSLAVAGPLLRPETMALVLRLRRRPHLVARRLASAGSVDPADSRMALPLGMPPLLRFGLVGTVDLLHGALRS